MNRIRWLLPLGLLFVGGLSGYAQQTDPTLTAAVLAQTAELKSIHKKRKKTQEQIIAAETAVTVALDRVHKVENKMLEYLSNAQGGGAEPLPNQTGGGTGNSGDSTELQSVDKVGGQASERNAHRLDGVGRTDGRCHTDGGSLSLHEATSDFGQLRCEWCGREQGKAQGQSAQFCGAVLYRQRGGDKVGGYQHRPIHTGLADTHSLVERPCGSRSTRRAGLT